ncbi:MAG: CPBP family intramembrane metalloprotease [Actinomycetaceae bacterium]|nr:CPBP family intramembrane metalloprotease [Actinomycetaceae bacterium]
MSINQTVTHTTSPSWRPVLVFVAIAYALAWLISIPLWLTGGLTSPFFVIVALLTMFTPMIAAALTVRFVEHSPLLDAWGWRVRSPWLKRTTATTLLTWLILFTAIMVALAISALFGTYIFDIAGMSAFRALIEAQSAAQGATSNIPDGALRAIWISQLAMIIPASFINAIPAMGEEAGWRGFLLPRLIDLVGHRSAILLMGPIWGLWHAPLLLLGYNYPMNPVLGLLMMSVFCTGVGAILAWATLRTGNSFAAALGHGFINSALPSLMLALASDAQPVDTVFATLMGFAGWPVLAVMTLWALFSLTRAGRESQVTPAPMSSQPSK